MKKEILGQNYFQNNSITKSIVGKMFYLLYIKIFSILKNQANKRQSISLVCTKKDCSFEKSIAIKRETKLKRTSKMISSLVINAPMLLINIIFLIYNIKAFENDKIFLTSIIIAGIWSFIGIPLISIFEYKVHPSFIYNIYQFYRNESYELNRVNLIKYSDFINKKSQKIKKIIFTLWVIAVILAFALGFNYILSFLNSKVSIIILVIDVLYYSYLTSLGISYCITMLQTVRNIDGIIDIPLDIDDITGVGNYRIISEYSLKTTQSLSSGVLFIPLLISFSNKLKISDSLPVFALIIIYSLLLLISILYPVYIGYKISSREKEDTINYINAELNSKINENIESPSEDNSMVIESLKMKIEQVEKIHTFPFEIEVGLSILTTVLMPIVMFFVNMFLTGDVVINIINEIKKIF